MLMRDAVDLQNRRDILCILSIAILSLIYILLFTLDPLEKEYSQIMVMGTLTGLFIIGQLPFIKRRIKRTSYIKLILIIQIILYLVI